MVKTSSSLYVILLSDVLYYLFSLDDSRNLKIFYGFVVTPSSVWFVNSHALPHMKNQYFFYVMHFILYRMCQQYTNHIRIDTRTMVYSNLHSLLYLYCTYLGRIQCACFVYPHKLLPSSFCLYWHWVLILYLFWILSDFSVVHLLVSIFFLLSFF